MTYEKVTTPNIDGSEFVTIKQTDDDGNVSFIPVDEANADYQAYLASLESPADEITAEKKSRKKS